ncbi:MAG: PrsW family intramembrane metalloprotease [Candidatus Abawacabacteria bacterium]|nr:PrsW family intramembrane metalloprotease [Candidatus Abawacabacteria bacterium]
MPALSTAFQDFFTWSYSLLAWIGSHPGLLVLLGTGALIPALFWLWLYYRQVFMDKEDSRQMAITFIFGMFAVLPVLGINYLLKSFLNFDLSQFVDQATIANHIPLIALGFIFMGALEEYAKFFIIRSVNDHQVAFNRIVDGIEYAVAGALGFAYIENIAYFTVAAENFAPDGLNNFWLLMSNMSFVQVVAARNFGTMLVHTLFSGFLGYYYGRAKIIGLEAEISEKKKLRQYLLFEGVKTRVHRLKMLWQKRTFPLPRSVHIRQEELIAEGLLVAVVLHATYNIFLHLDVSFLIAPMIIAEFAIIMHELHVDKNLKVYDLEKEARSEIRKELQKKF